MTQSQDGRRDQNLASFLYKALLPPGLQLAVKTHSFTSLQLKVSRGNLRSRNGSYGVLRVFSVFEPYTRRRPLRIKRRLALKVDAGGNLEPLQARFIKIPYPAEKLQPEAKRLCFRFAGDLLNRPNIQTKDLCEAENFVVLYFPSRTEESWARSWKGQDLSRGE